MRHFILLLLLVGGTLSASYPLSDYFASSGNSTRGNGRQYYLTAAESLPLTQMTVKFYSDGICTTEVGSVAMTQTTTLVAGTYHSSDFSNYALCSSYTNGLTGGCADNNGGVLSMQFSYQISGQTAYGACLADALQQDATGTCLVNDCGLTLQSESDNFSDCTTKNAPGCAGTTGCVWTSGACYFADRIHTCEQLDYDNCYLHENSCLWIGTCIPLGDRAH